MVQCKDMHFASFLSGGFTNMAVINSLERKLAKHISVQWCAGRKTNVLALIVIQKM